MWANLESGPPSLLHFFTPLPSYSTFSVRMGLGQWNSHITFFTLIFKLLTVFTSNSWSPISNLVPDVLLCQMVSPYISSHLQCFLSPLHSHLISLLPVHLENGSHGLSFPASPHLCISLPASSGAHIFCLLSLYCKGWRALSLDRSAHFSIRPQPFSATLVISPLICFYKFPFPHLPGSLPLAHEHSIISTILKKKTQHFPLYVLFFALIYSKTPWKTCLYLLSPFLSSRFLLKP